MKPLIYATLGAYVVWVLILKYGTTRQKLAADAFFTASPIPPIP